MRLPIVALAIALLGTACGASADGPSVSSSGPTASPSRPAALTQRCANPAAGYTISYPEGWSTNGGDVIPRCRVFDPDPMALEPDTEIPFDLAVTVRSIDRTLTAGDIEDSPGTTVLRQRSEQVAGRPAVRLRVEATGEAMLPAGVRGELYLIDLDGRTLLAATYDAGGQDLNTNARTLRQMVSTLDVDDGG